MERQTWRLEIVLRGEAQPAAFENMQTAVIEFIERRNPLIEVLVTALLPDEGEGSAS